MSLEKHQGCAGKTLEVICGAWSEQSLSRPCTQGWLQRGGKREQQQAVLGVTVRGCKQQGTRLFF